jgi:superfamily II DNA or RNA helicase
VVTAEVKGLNFLQLIDFTNEELEQIRHSFNKRISNWRFHPLVKKGLWDGYISFIDKTNRLPVGLWSELTQLCEKYKFQIEFSGLDKIIDYEFDEEDFRTWVAEFFSDHPKLVPRVYQIDACIPIIKYRKSISEIATSAGKTLIIFMIFGYLYTKGLIEKFLMIVPNTNLVLQTIEDFEFYNQDKIDFVRQMIYGGSDRKVKNPNFIIGTYQSLIKLDTEFYESINSVCVDEAHHTQAKSIKDILSKCKNARYTFGLSGTLLQNGSTEALTIQAYLGPLVNNIPASFLIENKYATPVAIKVVKMQYLNDEMRMKLEDLRSRKEEVDGTKMLEIEKRLVVENQARFKFVCDFIAKTTKNTLVLFQNVKDSYGRRIYDYLRESTTDKNVYYVDGGTSINLRDDYIENMKVGENKILVASFNTFSTGISINNIYNIFFVESYKSEKIIRQSIGRGLRLFEGKEKVNIIDFVDDFSTGEKWKNKNYLIRHSDERIKVYQEQGFPYKIYNVNIT